MPRLAVTKVTLNAAQAAGTAQALAANANRRALIINSRSAGIGVDRWFALSDASDGFGFTIPAKGAVIISDERVCPTQAIFLGGYSVGDQVSFWEG